MALKDWKKTKDRKVINYWMGKKVEGREIIFERKDSVGKITIVKTPDTINWKLWVSKLKQNDLGIDVLNKVFKTKSEALRYARNYMRKH